MAEKQNLAKAAVLFLVLSALGGCYDPQAVNEFLRRPRAPVSAVDYRILPPDVLLITSRQVPEINGQTQTVRPDGKINLPLVGEIEVAGKTPKEVEKLLVEASKEYYEQTDATVAMAPNGYQSQKFYVFGQVATPGPYVYTGHDTLLDALARAQPTYLAWPERIVVVRGSRPQEGGYTPSTQPSQSDIEYFHKYGQWRETPERPRERMVINLWAMTQHGDYSHNIYLQPNDVIYVQANPFAKVGLALQSILYPVQSINQATNLPSAFGNNGNH